MIATVEDALIEIPKEEVVSKLEAYRALNKRNLSRTDELYKRALRNLKRYSGSRLVDMGQVIERGGLDESNRPKLAVGRADWKEVVFNRNWHNQRWCPNFKERNSRSEAKDSMVVFPNTLFADVKLGSGVAIVPMVPIEKRPIEALSNYWILWEAEYMNIPVDPYLLKRIDDSLLFVVIDSWDLTPLEQMVMRATR